MNLEALYTRLERPGDLLVLTANDGLARTLQQNFAGLQKTKERLAWPQPKITSLKNFAKEWLPRQESVRHRLLLDADQSAIVWANCIRETSRDILLDARTTAQLARQAENLWAEYELCESDFSGWNNEESQLFLRWRKQFWNRMDARGWWPLEQATVLMLQALENGANLNFKSLVLAGFEELTPLQNRLLQRIRDLGVDLVFLGAERPAAVPAVRSFPVFEDELDAAAAWALGLIEENPRLQVGIVMPGLEVLREQVHHRLGSTLATATFLGAESEGRPPFHLSLGKPLLQWAPVRHLLLLWQLLHKRISYEQAELVFSSPFLWRENSRVQRQVFLGRLNKKRLARISARNCCFELERFVAPDDEEPENWAQAFQAMHQDFQSLDGTALPSRWAEKVGQWAESASWLRGAGVSSAQFQLRDAVQKALERLAKLDLLLEHLSFDAFLEQLQTCWSNETFQPESLNENIRVLGLLEAMGQSFDAVWVCRMNEGIWPATGQPNPFIPHPLQREKEMPHASVQREVAFGRLTLERMLQAAPRAVISFSRQQGEIPLQPSPLLAGGLHDVQAFEGRVNPWSEALMQEVRPDYFRDWQGTPLHVEQLRGGASIFEQQVQCPFKAYASKRLRAKPLEEPQPAVAADQHGRLLHGALAAFWKKIKSHARLVALSANDLEAEVRASVDVAWGELRHALLNTDALFEEVEKSRVSAHILVWLSHEKERPPFEVEQIEAQREVRFADKKLSLIVDRVDLLENGDRLCIDYKTGKGMKASDLVKEPLEQAQLPLYALTLQPTPQAVAYGVLNVAETHLNGLAADSAQSHAGLGNRKKPRGMQESWEKQTEVWNDQLQATLSDYLSGQAARTPLRASVCQYCSVRAICRKDEQLVLPDAEGDHG